MKIKISHSTGLVIKINSSLRVPQTQNKIPYVAGFRKKTDFDTKLKYISERE